jgi:ribosomal protein L40E
VYGKALSGDPSTDIAAKYMPRSIIDIPAESTAAPAQVVQGAAAVNHEGAQTAGDWKLGETVYCRTCGAANPWQSAFCDQCGSRLVWPDVEKPTENRIKG